MEAGVGREHELAAATLTLAGGFVADLGHRVRFEIFHHGWISFALPSEPTKTSGRSVQLPDCTAPAPDRAPGAGLATAVAG